MALSFGFYDSLNGDRKYNARQWSSIFDGVVRDGVLASVGNCFLVTAPGNSMTLTVGSGRAWFDHTWILSDGDTNHPITFTWDAAHGLSPEPVNTRIDAIVIETNSDPNVRANTIKVLKGNPSTGAKPSMTHTTYVNQYPIAYVTIRPNITVITQSSVENAVGTTQTPFVTGILQVLDSNALLAQWAQDYVEWKSGNTSDFNTWKTTEQNNFLSWRTSEQTVFSAWVADMEGILTPAEAASLAAAIASLKRTFLVTLYANQWTAESGNKYYQTQQLIGIRSSDEPVLVKNVSDTASAADISAYNKAYGIIANGVGVTNTDSVTWHVLKRPATDIVIGLKGV